MSLLTNVRLFDGAVLGAPSTIGISDNDSDGVFVAADAVSGDADVIDCGGAVPVLIGGDPLHDIAATKDIRRIWSAGVPVVAKG